MLLDSNKVLNNFIGNNLIAANLLKTLNNSNFSGVWLLKGPKGIGKAKLANKIIAEVLEISADNKSELIHPDLFVLKNNSSEKKFIPVEDVRKVSSFLSKTSIKGKCRFVLIDSLNEINLFGYNALLKTIEDYSIYTNFFLIDHMLNEIPNTINSRCKTFTFKKLSEEKIQLLLEETDSNKEEQHGYAILANGSIGEALNLQKYNALNIHKIYCEFILEKITLKKVQELFKKKDINVFNISFLILSRLLILALKELNNINNIIKLNDLEEEVIAVLSKSLESLEVFNLIDALNNNKKNTINLNLDMFTSLNIFLSELKGKLNKNE